MLEIAALAARIILENGAETYRVEDTVVRLCESYGFANADVIALSTGVFISVSSEAGGFAAVRRVSKRGMNLSRVNQVNDLSRGAADGTIPMEDALPLLKKIQEGDTLPPAVPVVLAGLAAACFALMFGGGPVEFATALACGMAAQLTALWLRRAEMSLVLVSVVGGALCAILSMISYFTFSMTPAGLETTLAGAIMPLISGLMMTNAVRDSLRGDLLSGLARSVEALLVAVMVALGISLPLKVFLPDGLDLMMATPPVWYLAALYAGIATLCFCPLLKLPARALLPVSLLGAAAYAGFLLLRDGLSLSGTLALFLAAAASALLCEILARRMRMIVTVFLSGALIPLVPGLALYRTMRELLYLQYESALAQGLAALGTVGAIALGAAVGPGLRHKREKKEW